MNRYLDSAAGAPSPLGAPPGSDYQMTSDFFECPLTAEEAGELTAEPGSAPGPAPSPGLDLAEADHLFVVGDQDHADAVEECGKRALVAEPGYAVDAAFAIRSSGFAGTAIPLFRPDSGSQRLSFEVEEALCDLGIKSYAPKLSSLLEERAKGAKRGSSLIRNPHAFFDADDDAMTPVLDLALKKARRAAVSEDLAAHISKGLKKSGLVDSRGAIRSNVSLAGADDAVPTGIATLDGVLDGGLQPGLAVVGAVSSLGKTTLCLQMAANMARQGYLVMFVSMEQSAAELFAKLQSACLYADFNVERPSSHILLPSHRAGFSPAEEQALHDASDKVAAEVADNLIVFQPQGRPTGSDVVDLAVDVQKLCWDRGNRGVVLFIDYLQLLSGDDVHNSERQAIDDNLIALRQGARDMKIPMVAISSLNRAAYFKGKVTTSSFKETGCVEYSSDVLLALEPAKKVINELEAEAKKADGSLTGEAAQGAALALLQGRPMRDVELSVLKYRNGYVPAKPVKLSFVSGASTFVDDEADPAGRVRAKKVLDDFEAANAPAKAPVVGGGDGAQG